jgi:hypothetical protein
MEITHKFNPWINEFRWNNGFWKDSPAVSENYIGRPALVNKEKLHIGALV